MRPPILQWKVTLALLAVVIGGVCLGSVLHSTGTLHGRVHTFIAISPVAGKAQHRAIVHHVRTEMHLNLPVYQQYWLFAWNLVQHGSSGYPFVNGTPVP